LAIYGESWANRFGRLLAGFGLSQSRLAAVIGLSAPMMSQLITGQRVKISNPAVYGRIVRLEELLSNPEVQLGDRDQVAQLLAEVAASQPSLTTMNGATAQLNTTASPAAEPALPARQQVIHWLAASTTAAGRAAAAQAAASAGDLELADILRSRG
jgi:transcriptional regulator with XRE-family HTH domain